MVVSRDWLPLVDGMVIDVRVNGPVRAGKDLVLRGLWDDQKDAPGSFQIELERSWFRRVCDRFLGRHRTLSLIPALVPDPQQRVALSSPWKASIVDKCNWATWTFVDDTAAKHRSGPLAVTTMDVWERATGASLTKLGVSIAALVKPEIEGFAGYINVQHSVYPVDADPDVTMTLLLPWGEGESDLWAFVAEYLADEDLLDVTRDGIQEIEEFRDLLPATRPHGWAVSFGDGQLDRSVTVGTDGPTTVNVEIQVGEPAQFCYAIRLDNLSGHMVSDTVEVRNNEAGFAVSI